MACHFIDWDGTFALWGTEKPLPGAREAVAEMLKRGDQVVITTLRSSGIAISDALRSMNLHGVLVLTNIQSPRLVYNDDGACAINHRRNMPWEDLPCGI